MGSELTIVARNADVPGLLAELQGVPDLLEHAREVALSGTCACLWGRVLSGVSSEMWSEAQEEADAGEGTIETIHPANGRPSFDAIVFHGPYRELVLEALRHTGEPYFRYESIFDLLDLRCGQARLRLSFDRAIAATGGPSRKPVRLPAGVVYLSTADGWMGRDGEATVADHMAVVNAIDILARHADVSVIDSTGYWDHRDEALLIAAMAEDRRLRAELRSVLADYDISSSTGDPEPPLTIARLLGDNGQP